jgi:hypothetical protein
MLAIILLLQRPGAGGPLQPQAGKASGTAVKPDPAGQNLRRFLEKPVDWVQWKNMKGISNNGAATRPAGEKSYYKPSERGFYYQYFNFPIFGQNTRGDSTPREGWGDVVVVVYKFGQTVGDYYDKREVLIEIGAHVRDCDLGEANLVGMNVSDIMKKFGDGFIKKNDVMVYCLDGKALALGIRGGKIDWFHCVRINFDIRSAEDIPAWLLEYRS